MASQICGQALLEIVNPSTTYPLDLVSDTKVKWVLTNSTYTPAYTNTLVDGGGANDIIDGEITATNYTSGYGGAGRTAISTPAFTNDTGNTRVEFDADDVTWTSLGGATNDTVTYINLIKEDHLGTTGNDTESRPIFAIDIADTTTNGGDFTVQWDAQGILQFA